MRNNYSYHTRHYRPREYSQSPQTEPICQNPPARTNTSTDHYYTRTSILKEKQPQQHNSNYYNSFQNTYKPIKTNSVNYQKTLYPKKSQKQNIGITEEKPKKKSKVLYIDVNTKVEEEVLMELYIRICALSMENERQRYKNVELYKQYNSVLSLLKVREGNLEECQRTIQTLQTKREGVVRTGDGRIKMLASENERLVDLKNTRDNEYFNLKTENDRVLKENKELRILLENKNKDIESELGLFEQDIVQIKGSYEEKIGQMSGLLKSKNTELMGLKKELEMRKITAQKKDSIKDDELKNYESKFNEIKKQLSNIDSRKANEHNALIKENEKIKCENENIKKEIFVFKQNEGNFKNEIFALKNEIDSMNKRISRKDEKDNADADGLITLIEELQKTIEEQEKIFNGKQSQYNSKIQDFSEKVKELAKKEDKHISEKSQLQTRIRGLENENRRLLEEIEMTEDIIEKFKNQNQKKKNSQEDKFKELEKMKRTFEEFEAEKKEISAHYETRLADLNKKYDAAIEERTKTQTEHNAFKFKFDNEIAKLNTENRKTRKELLDAKTELESNSNTVHQINELHTILNQKDEALHQKTQEIRELNDLLTEANEKMIDFDLQRNSTKQEIHNVQKEQLYNNSILENKLESLLKQYNGLKDQYEKDIQNYEKKVKELTDRLVDAEMKDNFERRKIGQESLRKSHGLNKEILELKNANGKLRTANETLQQQITSLKTQYSQLEDRYETDLKLKESEVKESVKFKDETSYLRQKIDDLLTKSNNYESSIEQYKNKNNNLRKEAASLKNHYTGLIRQLEDALCSKDEGFAEFKAEAENERFRLTTEVDALQNESNRLRKKVASLEETNADCMQKHMELMERLETAEGGQFNNKTEAEELLTKLELLKETSAEDKRKFDLELSQQLERHEGKVKKLREDYREREERLQSELSALQNRYNKLQLEFERLSNEHIAFQKNSEDAKTDIHDDSHEKNDLKAMLEASEEENKAMRLEFIETEEIYRKEIKAMEEEFADKIGEYEDKLEQMLAELSLYRKTQKENTESLRDKSSQYEDRFTEMGRQVNELEQRYESLKKEYDESQTQNKESKAVEEGLRNNLKEYENKFDLLNRHMKENDVEFETLHLEFKKNMESWNSWQVEKDGLIDENMRLQILCEDRTKHLEDMGQLRNEALMKVFQMSLLAEGLIEGS